MSAISDVSFRPSGIRPAAGASALSSSEREPPTPRIWVMNGYKAGDNSQVLGLANGLDWPYEIKRLVYRPTELETNLLAPLRLWGIKVGDSSPLEPPWPDLIISAGRRNEPPCRWTQARAAEAGHRVRLVHVGRPWAAIENFDLIVTTPQYRLPDVANVLQNRTPLHRVTPERLDAAAAEWSERLDHLPRPRIAVMIGGNAGPYVFDREAAALLGRAASALARRLGGSLMISTSARTPRHAIPDLDAAIDVPAHIFHWSPDATDNPYLGYLALADQIVVTCESMSMLAEACWTLKPVHMFDLHTGAENQWSLMGDLLGQPLVRSFGRRLRRYKFQPLVYRTAMRIGPTRLTRDVRIIQRRFIDEGRAVWLGQPFPENTPRAPLDDLERAVARVRALFDPPEAKRVLGAAD
jgi:mitochondrial fission protein ELM1